MVEVAHIQDFDPGDYVRKASANSATLHLIVENMQCPACMKTIEDSLHALPGVEAARVNLSTKRLTVTWDDRRITGPEIVATLAAKDYRVTPFDPELLRIGGAAADKRLLWALAVAGFAAVNVMILSVAVWSGLGGDMGPATRGLLHWISALIALPVVAFSGQPFFQSAAGALRNARLNMDVPISLAVLLAAGMSLAETIRGAEQVYFDACVMLLFFLLIGRYLDRRARGRASDAAQNLLSLGATAATVITEDGRRKAVPVRELREGVRVAVAAGDTLPADGVAESGKAEIDNSLITGESMPQATGQGQQLYAGATVMGGEVILRVTATGDDTLLAEIVRLLEVAEQGRARYVRLADQAARIYAPVVHLLGLATFLGWLLFSTVGWQTALFHAIAVLIITCPCALGLAVPAVQVVASGLLLRLGVLVKTADGIEKLALADTVVFDKTGTLTEGRPVLVNLDEISEPDRQLAAMLAASSRHPLSRALIEAVGSPARHVDVRELPGDGLIAQVSGIGEVRLGNRLHCGVAVAEIQVDSEIWLAAPDRPPVCFRFRDQAKPDAKETISRLRQNGYRVALLSGDNTAVVSRVAAELAIDDWHGDCQPADKVERLEALKAGGHRVLMIGDGLNDAPALGAAFVSGAFARGADVSQAASDFVFQNPSLAQLPKTMAIARGARRLILQNFAVALLYNVIAVPMAVVGLVTPLIAAVAMSTSSLLVTGNALRLRWRFGGRRWT